MFGKYVARLRHIFKNTREIMWKSGITDDFILEVIGLKFHKY